MKVFSVKYSPSVVLMHEFASADDCFYPSCTQVVENQLVSTFEDKNTDAVGLTWPMAFGVCAGLFEDTIIPPFYLREAIRKTLFHSTACRVVGSAGFFSGKNNQTKNKADA